MARKFAGSESHGEPLGILCRTVYADGKKYVGELWETIISAWENVNVSVLQKLVNSMCDRVFKVIVKQGSFSG